MYSFIVGHDNKIAFVGGNELAKTTLFKILAGELEPDAGSYKWGVTTSQSYFPKDNTEIFDTDLLIVDWLTPVFRDQRCHLCARFPRSYALCRRRRDKKNACALRR